ncbi:MAG TPA: hypothetical protein VKV19_07600 [Ktedonobacteraceae bacterium]|nr:hypothetical protein [Ktedonobacteraceae bacterium]
MHKHQETLNGFPPDHTARGCFVVMEGWSASKRPTLKRGRTRSSGPLWRFSRMWCIVSQVWLWNSRLVSQQEAHAEARQDPLKRPSLAVFAHVVHSF